MERLENRNPRRAVVQISWDRQHVQAWLDPTKHRSDTEPGPPTLPHIPTLLPARSCVKYISTVPAGKSAGREEEERQERATFQAGAREHRAADECGGRGTAGRQPTSHAPAQRQPCGNR